MGRVEPRPFRDAYFGEAGSPLTDQTGPSVVVAFVSENTGPDN
jgi:hypothetical protein